MYKEYVQAKFRQNQMKKYVGMRKSRMAALTDESDPEMFGRQLYA